MQLIDGLGHAVPQKSPKVKDGYVITQIKLAPLVREISWNNNIIIMEKCKDNLQREFYIRMTKRYGWTKRVLANSV